MFDYHRWYCDKYPETCSIITSHVLEEIRSMANYISYMKNGRLSELIPVEVLPNSYVDFFKNLQELARFKD